jgi:hypothetical protein
LLPLYPFSLSFNSASNSKHSFASGGKIFNTMGGTAFNQSAAPAPVASNTNSSNAFYTMGGLL